MKGTVRRDGYLRMLHAGRDLTDIVKVVTGMRRTGKSVLLEQYAEDLLASGVKESEIVFIRFETFEYRGVDTGDKLDGILKKAIGKSGRKYVFLDEIQNVDGWERSVSSLINTGRCDVYIAGSNSKVLSSELSTHISGRYVEVPVLPLSFSEYMELHPGEREVRFSEYLRYGALPEVDPARGEKFCGAQLTGIFNTVMVGDVLARLGSSDVTTLTAIARFVYSNIGNITNVDAVSNALKIGNDTVNRYLSKMTEAFLFYRAERYDIVGKKILRTNGKFYASDLGLRSAALAGAEGTDISRPLENVVFLELLRRGYTVRTGSYRGHEVDFTAFKGGRTDYFQVCLSILPEDTRGREFRPLNGLNDYSSKVILTMDRVGLGTENGTEIMNVIDWLLSRSDAEV